jgi:Fic family protein
MAARLPVPKGITYRDAEDKVRLESRNGAIQAAFLLETANNWNRGANITPAHLLELQRLAVNQIYRCAGHFRDDKVILQGAGHVPPHHSEVEAHVVRMCDYINSHWNDRSAVHLAAYAMWRVNWIHPFFGGNGRTARAFSYLVLCAGLGFALPGSKTIPEFIVEDRDPYYEALKKADASVEQDRFDVSRMELLVSSLLAKQLKSVHDQATGTGPR